MVHVLVMEAQNNGIVRVEDSDYVGKDTNINSKLNTIT